jgi:hypothetical protein
MLWKQLLDKKTGNTNEKSTYAQVGGSKVRAVPIVRALSVVRFFRALRMREATLKWC